MLSHVQKLKKPVAGKIIVLRVQKVAQLKSERKNFIHIFIFQILTIMYLFCFNFKPLAKNQFCVVSKLTTKVSAFNSKYYASITDQFKLQLGIDFFPGVQIFQNLTRPSNSSTIRNFSASPAQFVCPVFQKSHFFLSVQLSSNLQSIKNSYHWQLINTIGR